MGLAGASARAGEVIQAACEVPGAEAVACASWTPLGEDSFAVLSGDGRTAVGTLAGEPMRWVDGVPLGLGPAPPGYSRGGEALGASRDGSVIVGYLISDDRPEDAESWSAEGYAAFRWEDGVYELLMEAPSAALGVSDDGQIVVGSIGANWDEASFVWDSGEVVDLVAPEEIGLSDVSGDGSVFGGSMPGPSYSRIPARWDGDAVESLVPDPHGEHWGHVGALSRDGAVVVGFLQDRRDAPYVCDDQGCATQSMQGFRWQDGVLTGLGWDHPDGAFARTSASDVSADGSLIAAAGSGNAPPVTVERRSVALLWSEANGLESLHSVLVDLGVDVPSWEDSFANSIADAGHLVAGAVRRNGDTDAFIANISPPVAIDIQPRRERNRVELARSRWVRVLVLGHEGLDVDEIATETLGFGPAEASPLRVHVTDGNDDGRDDQLLVFRTADLAFSAGDAEACLIGRARGLPFQVCAPVDVTLFGCGRGFGLAAVVPPLLWLRRRARASRRT